MKWIETVPLPDEHGGGDWSLVRMGPVRGDTRLVPHCVNHGAMNKISPDGIWRCITTASATAGKRCNAGALRPRGEEKCRAVRA